ncbi:MAG TPA: TonB-dependent receptor, partial [Bacteroidia bacterium]|nr:TonB-dependent receptor [Bacteroidia bacterium]
MGIYSYAQNNPVPASGGTIKGRIIDSTTGQPVSYASISLSTITDNKEVNGVTTGDDGSFKLTGIDNGTYKLQIYFVGYQTGTVNNITISKTQANVILGNIKLASASAKLKQVVVAADKSTIENKVDKIVYNVDKDLTAQGGVATDALKKVPEVSVDVDGNVELQGNSNIRFLINGKPSTMFGTNLADVLQSIPASEIEKIEVITSPGAKYDAEGIGGIINIILKKVTAQGINGNLSASAGTLLENGSFNLNMKKGNFGAHAFFNANERLNATVYSNSTRTGQDTNNQKSLLTQNGSAQLTRAFYQGGVGFDWDITPKDNISASFSYNHFQVSGSGSAAQQSIEQDQYGNTLSTVNSLLLSTNTFSMQNLDGSMDYKKTFEKNGQELDVSYNISSGTYNSYYSQSQQDVPSEYTFSGSYGQNPATSLENTASIDYAQPLDTSGTLLEMGAKADVNALSGISNVYLLNTADGDYAYNAPQSSGINYTTSVYAGYLSASFKMFKWLDVKAGYRYEYTMINASFANIGNVNVPAYGTNVPSLTISHKYSGNNTLKLSYSHRIQRPDGEDLNPFVNANNPQNITTGNPNLQPEIGDKIEFGYNKIFDKGGNLFITLFYRGNR